ncbi:THUMP-like domain-containing protein [Cyclobacterium jeungdonense]|uniref:rRNA adenine N-6-methyltransferase family protein n=1 Tax=Cyclobacterium jeungdonense TaxID=708087 RepID=A0ABT8C4V2_9BACT|nr:rRNA adenine N-6-methyltransferase family protein [Cyclobacterium jeungdonense]MDN3687761.1 rRNA adenine N-6-methyltransferase family protein [Cyclobacterium jeungdonense]
MQDHLEEDPAQLLLRHKEIPGLDIKAAARQIAMRQKARHKLPAWAAHPSLIFPPSLSMEQCSSEATGKYKCSLVQGKTMVDLTGGFGVDTFYLGEKMEQVTYVEQQEELVALARHNLPRLFNNQQVSFVHQDALAFLRQSTLTYDWLYVDPARRGKSNQKLFQLKDLEPDVVSNWGLFQQKASSIMVKASPMLDISEACRELPGITQVHVLSVKNEVKELLLINDGSGQPLSIVSAEIREQGFSSFTFSPEEEAQATPELSFPKKYLVIPYASILKAGAFKSFSVKQDLAKLHAHTHIYTSDHFPEGVPGRVFEVLEEIRLDKKVLKKQYPEGKVHVISRNHPMKADVIKKKFRLKDGGEEFLIACTQMDGKPGVWRCRRMW